MAALLAVVGVPGGLELLIILLVTVLWFGVPLVLIVGGLLLYRRMDDGEVDEDRVEQLEREVAELRRRQEERENDS